MNFQIHVDPLLTLENQYKEALEKGTEPYPTLADFDVNTPLELLEHYPIMPILWTIQKIYRQMDVTPFLKLQKPIANLPQTEQMELIRYMRDVFVDFIPQHCEGNNVQSRRGALQNGTRFYKASIAASLIKQFGLGFTEEDLDTCERCGDRKCWPDYRICSACGYPIWQCENNLTTFSHLRTRTCKVCGEEHQDCIQHVRTPKEKKCSVHRRKSPVPPLSSFETGEIVTIETRRLLQRLKTDAQEILQELRDTIPTLIQFHTLKNDALLTRFPIIPATLTFLKDLKRNPSLYQPIPRADKAGAVKFISAMRDTTAVEWGYTLADASATAFIKQNKLKLSLAEIDTCPKCGDPTCAGIGGGGVNGYCDVTMEGSFLVDGCRELCFPCDARHNTILTCDNPLCTKPKYRQCTEHTCEVKDHTDLVYYLFELEKAGVLTPNVQTFVKRINALTPDQQADFVKQFHATVAGMDPIEKTAAAVQTTLRKHGLKTTFEKPEMK